MTPVPWRASGIPNYKISAMDVDLVPWPCEGSAADFTAAESQGKSEEKL